MKFLQNGRNLLTSSVLPPSRLGCFSLFLSLSLSSPGCSASLCLTHSLSPLPGTSSGAQPPLNPFLSPSLRRRATPLSPPPVWSATVTRQFFSDIHPRLWWQQQLFSPTNRDPHLTSLNLSLSICLFGYGDDFFADGQQWVTPYLSSLDLCIIVSSLIYFCLDRLFRVFV